MNKKNELRLLAAAQRELEEIARVHLSLVGPVASRKVTDRIYDALEKLTLFPELGSVCRDKQLASEGYRMLVCENYLCFYRQIGPTIFIYHIVDGRTNYPRLFQGSQQVDL